ncbi:hypothetical protein LBMAG49_14430 [Planctomycetota bacterium]|nr:hypothetical protein LBMAG49_14430 [Planctomycetota bacterium]
MNIAKQNVLLLAAAALLAVPTWLTLSRERELFVDIAAVPHMFEGFAPDSAMQLTLALPKGFAVAPAESGAEPKKPAVEYDSLAFARSEKGFVLQQSLQSPDLTGAPVNKDALEAQVFRHLASLRVDKETLVQADATDEQLASYGLEPAKAFVIQVRNASQALIVDLRVGNDAGGKATQSTVSGTFVMKGDNRDVVLYEPSPQAGVFTRSIKPDPWIDRTVLRSPPDKTRKIAIRNSATDGKLLSFIHPEGKGSWTVENPNESYGALRQQDIEMLAQRLGYVVAQDMKRLLQGANLKALGLEPPQMDLVVTYQDGAEEKTIQLGIGNKVDGKNERYLRSSASSFLMTWGSAYVDFFDKDPSGWFDPKAITGPSGEVVKDPAPKAAEEKPGVVDSPKGQAAGEQTAAPLPGPAKPIGPKPEPQKPAGGGAP